MSHCVSHGSPCVPRKASAAEPVGHGRPPLEELVEGADGEADGRHEGEEPAVGSERRQGEAAVRRNEDWNAYEDGQHPEEPSEPVLRRYSRPDEDAERQKQQDEGLAGTGSHEITVESSRDRRSLGGSPGRLLSGPGAVGARQRRRSDASFSPS